MHYRLEITLLSAASPGCGEGWAGMIDSDVFFDDHGLPFIPARRIRGILRDMAHDVACAFETSMGNAAALTRNDVAALFGRDGQAGTAPLSVEDAQLDQYHEVRQWLRWAQCNFEGLVTPDRVIQTFTHLRRQTAIGKHGVAQEGSLRTTRVLNRGLQFFSPVTLAGNDEKHQTLLALAAQVTRFLGSKRNRGLGRVACRLRDAETNVDVTQKALSELASGSSRGRSTGQ